ncbi:hypothetical protein [Sphingobacterium sp. FBM7-1]|uniref:hypothetical protein n=1 Tax=Sphingobacterium sp. FBM7-1 TaxID=2886688 RepID=UPI001D128F65|nr:hypothetical protein [Sphingobacterium sp. FBM7-1]MCC2598987.1 hypothetical protein [Sphingobacterium sp. FBM7-1]
MTKWDNAVRLHTSWDTTEICPIHRTVCDVYQTLFSKKGTHYGKKGTLGGIHHSLYTKKGTLYWKKGTLRAIHHSLFMKKGHQKIVDHSVNLRNSYCFSFRSFRYVENVQQP